MTILHHYQWTCIYKQNQLQIAMHMYDIHVRTCTVHACKLEAIRLHAQFHYSTVILKVSDSAKDKTIQS